MKMRISAIAAWCWLVLASTAIARDIYVNNLTGDDRRSGRHPLIVGPLDGPVRTITRALEIATGNDRIVLANTGVPYRESVTLQAGRHSGLPTKPFVLEGNGAVLEGLQEIPTGRWEFYQDSAFRFRPSGKSFHLLFLDGRPAERVAVAGDAAAVPQLQPLQWCLYRGHVYFRPEPGRLPDSYDLSHTSLTVGITLYEVRHVAIMNLTIQGYQLDGINAHDGVFHASLSDLICRGNGRSGISVGGASNVLVEACLVGNNGAAQLRAEGFSHTRVVNCDLLDNTAPAIVRDGGEVIVE
jgi:hypothetical protein